MRSCRIAVVLFLLACGGESAGPDLTPRTIAITPASITLGSIGATQQLAATAHASNNTVVPVTISWTSSNTAVATVDVNGTVTAVANGSTTISAAAGTISGTVQVTVEQVPTTVAVSPAPVTMAALGATQQLSAVARDANNHIVPGTTAQWSSSSAAVATVSASGLVTAVANGTAVITAMIGSLAGTATATVAQVASSVTVTPTPSTLTSLGSTVQLTATARDAGGSTVSGTAFTWATSAAATATVSNAGLVTAVANGTSTITATTGSLSGAAVVTVAQAVASVSVAPTTVSLSSIGATQQLTATARDAGNSVVSGAPMTWTSSAAGVATVSATGLVTSVAIGTATITAASGTRTAAAAVTVTQAIASVTVTPANPTFTAFGATQQFTAVARDASNMTVPGRVFAWSSSTPAVATITSSGLATAVSSGTSTITATTGGVNGTTVMTVSVDPCTSRNSLSLTGVNYTSVSHGSAIIQSTDCVVATAFGSAGTMDRGHRWDFANSRTGQLEFLMTSTSFSPVLQLRTTTSAVLASADAGLGSSARFSYAPGTGNFRIIAGAKSGHTGSYDLYFGKYAPDIAGNPCLAVSVLNVTAVETTVDGELGDSVGCGTGAGNTSDIFLLPNPYAPQVRRLFLIVEGRGAVVADRTFQPVFDLFTADGQNLMSLPSGDENREIVFVCVDPANPNAGWFQASIGGCTPDSFGQSTTIRGGAPGLFFVRVRAAKAGQYRIRYKWVN
jgi:uncharacterized protein YjdB